MKLSAAERARIIAAHGSLEAAVESGQLSRFQDLSTSEALILGLYSQNVRTFIGIFGHGSTDIGEVMRVYEAEGLIKTVQVRSEIEASHAAAALKWQYGITAAVFTSLGPGALQALSASLVPLSNSLGIYYIFGDETTHSEGPNMQQIPRREQELFLRLAATMGGAYSIHTPEALFTALKRGAASVHSSSGEKPYYLLMPMNIQPKVTESVNILEFPGASPLPPQCCGDPGALSKAAGLISGTEKITVKIGGGARSVSPALMKKFLDLSGSVFVHGPVVPGIVPASDRRNMYVGGSKGSICGNYALGNCELLIVIGARGVCQWDSSGTAFPNAANIININTSPDDLAQYNRTVALPGDASLILEALSAELEKTAGPSEDTAWQKECFLKKTEWEEFKKLRFDAPLLHDQKFEAELPAQPAAIKTAVDFADSIGAVKFFDAGDVQANGFQITADEKPGMTFTDTGASYMGFAVSALLASAIAEDPAYPVAFTGDGSFMMNPQVLIDAAEHGLRGMILLFDNRRMAAISSLQHAQYGIDYRTDDSVAVDYAKIASSVAGVAGFTAPPDKAGLIETLRRARDHQGLSLVHIPVYFGKDELSGLGAFGSWNVGNWCEEVQKKKHAIGL